MGEIEENEKPSANREEALTRDAPQLVAVLKEMKSGLDLVTGKVQALTQKVKENQYPTADGISYLEAKHLLLLGYCQSIVYYLLRKAKGLPIDGHPVVRCLVEIRLFLEKIRPIDKKLEYQVQKLTRAASNAVSDKKELDEGKKDESQDAEDPLKYRPNPNMLVSQSSLAQQDGGVYRPPRFAPTAMDEDKISKQEKQALRKEKEALKQAKHSAYLKELMDEVEGRPQEIRDSYGSGSRHLSIYMAKCDERARQEEELFIRAPVTKLEKKKEKHLLKSRDGLLGLTDGFYDEIRTLPFEESGKDDNPPSYSTHKSARKFNKRKRKH